MSKAKPYKNPNMIKFSDVADVKTFGWFCRAYYPHVKLLIDLSKPAQKVIVGILGLLEDSSNERIKAKIGFMPWEGKFNMTQSDFAREFNLDRRYVSKGIKELKARNILVEQDNIFYLNPIFFSHQDYYNKETLDIFKISAEERKSQQNMGF
jgi:hypothetical protein